MYSIPHFLASPAMSGGIVSGFPGPGKGTASTPAAWLAHGPGVQLHPHYGLPPITQSDLTVGGFRLPGAEPSLPAPQVMSLPRQESPSDDPAQMLRFLSSLHQEGRTDLALVSGHPPLLHHGLAQVLASGGPLQFKSGGMEGAVWTEMHDGETCLCFDLQNTQGLSATHMVRLHQLDLTASPGDMLAQMSALDAAARRHQAQAQAEGWADQSAARPGGSSAPLTGGIALACSGGGRDAGSALVLFNAVQRHRMTMDMLEGRSPTSLDQAQRMAEAAMGRHSYEQHRQALTQQGRELMGTDFAAGNEAAITAGLDLLMKQAAQALSPWMLTVPDVAQSPLQPDAARAAPGVSPQNRPTVSPPPPLSPRATAPAAPPPPSQSPSASKSPLPPPPRPIPPPVVPRADPARADPTALIPATTVAAGGQPDNPVPLPQKAGTIPHTPPQPGSAQTPPSPGTPASAEPPRPTQSPKSPLVPRAPLTSRSPQPSRRDVLVEPNPADIPGVPTLEELGLAPTGTGSSARTSASPTTPAARDKTAVPNDLRRVSDRPLSAAEEAEFESLVAELLPQDREKMGFAEPPNPDASLPPAPDDSDLPTEIPPTYDEVVAMETVGVDPFSAQGAQVLRAYSHRIDQNAADPTALMKGLASVIERLAEPSPSAWQNLKRAVLGRSPPPAEPITLRGEVLTRLMAGVRRMGDGFVASDPALPSNEFRQERLAYLEEEMTGALQASLRQLSPAAQKRAIARMKDEQNDIWRGLRNSAAALGRQRPLTKLGPSAAEFILETGQMHDILMEAMKRVGAEGAAPRAASAA